MIRRIPGNVREVKEVLPVAARALRLTIQPWEVRAAEGFREGIRCAKQAAPGWTLRARRPLMLLTKNGSSDLALKSRLPSMYINRESVDAGGLMYYGADVAESYRRVAYYVDRILKGAKPADLPVEQPTKFELVINLKTAKQIGVTIPPEVLARATRIIK